MTSFVLSLKIPIPKNVRIPFCDIAMKNVSRTHLDGEKRKKVPRGGKIYQSLKCILHTNNSTQLGEGWEGYNDIIFKENYNKKKQG